MLVPWAAVCGVWYVVHVCLCLCIDVGVHVWYKIWVDNNIFPHHCALFTFQAWRGVWGRPLRTRNQKKNKSSEWLNTLTMKCRDLQRNGMCYLLCLSSGNTSSHWLKCQLVLVLEKKYWLCKKQGEATFLWIKHVSVHLVPHIRSQLLLVSFAHYFSVLIEAAYAH